MSLGFGKIMKFTFFNRSLNRLGDSSERQRLRGYHAVVAGYLMAEGHRINRVITPPTISIQMAEDHRINNVTITPTIQLQIAEEHRINRVTIPPTYIYK
ncbi:hypothetical protein PoB_004706800 [Plakobranchus ocellatus]|uniref:Uncharacterized protein n=1 Tax=Plakobranchus ocellatus TaxID=259542 RepID=A0AAV4BP35_9GAST|nr:hypothetical protein PoB_004706800 [Plakobranchus ocellatus]